MSITRFASIAMLVAAAASASAQPTQTKPAPLVIDGLKVYPRTKEEITAKLAQIHTAKVDTVADLKAPALPNTRAPKQSDADRHAGVRLLNEYRYLCNVPADVALDTRYNAHCEAAAALLAQIDQLNHNPPNPDWPPEEYELARVGCSSSNLYMGTKNSPMLAVQSFMDDSDPGNVDRVGHRRWCLNPKMSRTGFGVAGQYTAMWSFDESRQKIPDYDFISYPAPGYFPNTHFDPKHAWHVSLNPQRYRKPDPGKIKLSVKPAQVTAAPPSLRTTDELKVTELHVDNAGFAIPNAIIFRFDKPSTQPGAAYLVEVSGLQTARGEPTSVKYLVEFFAPSR